MAKAVGDLKSASSFSLAGTASDPNGDYTVHLDYKPGTGCKGTVAQAGSLTKLCDVNALTSSLSLPTDVVKGKVTTVGDEQVLPLTDKAKGGMLYVTDTSSPQIVELVNTTGGNSGKIIFTVGHPVTVTAPPASQSVDASLFGL